MLSSRLARVRTSPRRWPVSVREVYKFWTPKKKPGEARAPPGENDAQAEKDEPQPQVVTALGLRMTNWAPSRPSV